MTDLGVGAKLRAAFELSPTILAVTALDDGRLIEVNDAFLRTTGYTREEIIGRPIPHVRLWVDPSLRERGLADLRAGSPVRGMEARFRTKSGEEIVAIANADLVDVDGQTCVLTALVDITARVRAEAALETLARAKDEFLAMLGHELRNPLAAITNALAVLDRLVADAEVRRVTGIIDRQTAHLSRLVDDLLDVARVTSGKIELRPQLLDLRELAVRSLEALQQAALTGRHQVEVEGEPIHVHGDPARIEQVIRNLVDNALKYTPAGGQVRVIVERADGHAVLRVRDTGEGIRPDRLERIFDLFVQEPQALDRSRGGLGLGLTLVKRLVELHGGAVSAASAGRGRGSEFTVRLPAAAEPGAHDRTGAAPASVMSGRPRRILIVEDSADARDSLRLILELAGHEVETSEDAPSCLEKVAAFRPDVALIDIGLPGIDGYRLAGLLRARTDAGDLRLIALTGYGQAEDRQKALDAGFDLHLTKPVEPARLQDLIAGP